MRWRVFWNSVFSGKWKFAWGLFENFSWGLFHRKCRQCGKKKVWNQARCPQCQVNNLFKALFVEDEYQGEE